MRHNLRLVGPDNNSSASTNVSYVFSDNGSNESLDSVPDQDSDNDLDDHSDDDLILDNKEGQELPAAYYLKKAK
jgi:hypothetical protein